MQTRHTKSIKMPEPNNLSSPRALVRKKYRNLQRHLGNSVDIPQPEPEPESIAAVVEDERRVLIAAKENESSPWDGESYSMKAIAPISAMALPDTLKRPAEPR